MNTVLTELKQRADGGDREAQYALAIKYYKSPELNDPRQGYFWLRASAEGGNLKAQKALGLLYSSSQYAPFPSEDAVKAFRMYEMAADQGDAQAAFWLGRCYLVGYGTVVSEEQGRKWIGEARARGYNEDEELLDAAVHTESDAPHTWEFSDSHKYSEDLPKTSEESAPKERSSVIGEVDVSKEKVNPDISDLRSGLIFALVGTVVGLVVVSVIHLLLMLLSGGSLLYGITLTAVMIICIAAGFMYGYKVSKARAKDREYYRSTPFYAQYGKDYENLDKAGKNAYEIFARLSKIMTPYGCSSRPLGKNMFGSVRGYMIPAMILPGPKGLHWIDLLLITEKSIYVIATSGVSGKISGVAQDEEWKVEGYSGSVRYLRNLLLKNADDIVAIKEAAAADGMDRSLLQALPFYSIVCFGSQTEVTQIEGIRNEQYEYVIAGDGEKIRSFIEMRDSRHMLHHEEMAQIMRTLEKQLRQYPENREALKKNK